MGLSQFLNTVGQIRRAEHVGFLPGFGRHLAWQCRRVMKQFPVDLKVSESTLHADRDSGQAALVNCLGMYDFNNLTLVRTLLSECDGVFCDVGANVGVYTLVASETGRPVVAIEAHPGTFKLLSHNVELNRRDNVKLVQVAASSHEQTVSFTDGQMLELNRVVSNGDSEGPTLNVPSKTLDSLCEQFDLWPTVVKIDVEGYEESVLAGFEEGLKRADVLVIENGSRATVADPLHEQGFRGPLHYFARTRTFAARPQSREEDPTFIREAAVEGLRESGFTI